MIYGHTRPVGTQPTCATHCLQHSLSFSRLLTPAALAPSYSIAALPAPPGRMLRAVGQLVAAPLAHRRSLPPMGGSIYHKNIKNSDYDQIFTIFALIR
jgi:hypothetical protein